MFTKSVKPETEQEASGSGRQVLKFKILLLEHSEKTLNFCEAWGYRSKCQIILKEIQKGMFINTVYQLNKSFSTKVNGLTLLFSE